MTYDEMISVLEAAKAGKVLEIRLKGSLGWNAFRGQTFNFADYEYRVKPEPKRCWVRWKNDGTVDCFSKHEPTTDGWTEMVEVVR